MNTPVTHKINITQGAVKYLRDMLSGTGWAKTVGDIILGGQLLLDVVPEVEEPPVLNVPSGTPPDAAKEIVKVHNLAARVWAAVKTKEFEVTEKQREACRKCIKHFAEQGAVPPTSQAADLLLGFGFTVE